MYYFYNIVSFFRVTSKMAISYGELITICLWNFNTALKNKPPKFVKPCGKSRILFFISDNIKRMKLAEHSNSIDGH